VLSRSPPSAVPLNQYGISSDTMFDTSLVVPSTWL
jgi:hypothetical protein